MIGVQIVDWHVYQRVCERATEREREVWAFAWPATWKGDHGHACNPLHFEPTAVALCVSYLAMDCAGHRVGD